MPSIIRDGRLAADTWARVDNEAPLPDGDVIVPLARFVADTPALLARPGRLGVCIAPGEGVAEIVPFLDRLALVALLFPVFYDGRGYSYARELRERHGYSGEIRAVGDVRRDQLSMLARCGVNAFVVREGREPAGEVAGLAELAVGYQADTRQPLPHYRR